MIGGRVRALLSGALVFLARIFGRKIIDARTGECVGRAFVRFSRGTVRFVGLQSTRPLVPRFKTTDRVTYWKTELEFASHPEPDFPNERSDD